MQFVSLYFFIFFVFFLLGFNAVPARFRCAFLLVGNVLYYLSWADSVLDMLPILAVTLLTWVCSIVIGQSRSQSIRKGALLVAVFAGVGSLVYYKYSAFLMDTLGSVLGRFRGGYSGTGVNILIPLGISFFTFQSLSYVFEVYRRNVAAERNFIVYAAYVTFFPTVMSGPIERPEGLLRQLRRPELPRTGFCDLKKGLLLVLYGGFVKYVAADRLAVIADTVFGSYMTRGTTVLAFAVICYTLQIYCDFFAYSLMAMGVGRMMGLRLTENFKAPYFARSIRDFWRRWHISLSTWFRDYVYIPLGGNRCSKARKSANLMTAFLVSGLWHGSSWTFVVWGCLHGLYQVIGDLTAPFRKKLYQSLSVKTDCFSFRLGQRLVTFTLVAVAWIFFRAETLQDAVGYITRMVTVSEPWNLFNNTVYQLGLDTLQMNILLCAMAVILSLDLAKYRWEKNVDELVQEQNWVFQGMIYILLFLAILVLGMYGQAYDAREFIYFQF